MALTVSEAQAVNDLLKHMFGGPMSNPLSVWDREYRARDGLALLADSANKKLQAGVTGDDVRRLWGKR